MSKTKYEVYGELSGEYKIFDTLKEAKAFIRGCNAFDKRNDLKNDSGGYGEPWIITSIEMED